jgi:DNA-binding NtrC family response regulator
MARTDHPPIVFITGHGDVASSVHAMKAGAVGARCPLVPRRMAIRATPRPTQSKVVERRARSRILGVDARTVRRWLTGAPIPVSMAKLLRVADAGHLSLADLTSA